MAAFLRWALSHRGAMAALGALITIAGVFLVTRVLEEVGSPSIEARKRDSAQVAAANSLRAEVARLQALYANDTADPEVLALSPDAPGLAGADPRLLNAKIPISPLGPGEARPFFLKAHGPSSRDQSLECLTAAVYYEAGNESAEGQAAVAQVVLNRLRHPSYPKSVCMVVFQGSSRSTGCQFTFTCDGSLARSPNPAGWRRARAVAAAALAGSVVRSVGEATHYHADYVAPYWAATLIKVTKIGPHIFYRGGGRLGSSLVMVDQGAPPGALENNAAAAGVDAVDTAAEANVADVADGAQPVILEAVPEEPEALPQSPADLISAAPAPELPVQRPRPRTEWSRLPTQRNW